MVIQIALCGLVVLIAVAYIEIRLHKHTQKMCAEKTSSAPQAPEISGSYQLHEVDEDRAWKKRIERDVAWLRRRAQ